MRQFIGIVLILLAVDLVATWSLGKNANSKFENVQAEEPKPNIPENTVLRSLPGPMILGGIVVLGVYLLVSGGRPRRKPVQPIAAACEQGMELQRDGRSTGIPSDRTPQ